MGFINFVKGKYKQTNNLMNQVSLLFILLGVGMIILNSINKNNSNSNINSDNTFKCEITNTNENQLTVETLNTSYSLSLIDFNSDVFKTDLKKNSIPAIFKPKFVELGIVKDCLADSELVLVVEKENEILAFPQKILRYHIAVNTYIKDQPILVTYSPLSEHYEVFSRNYKTSILEFGISGALYKNVDLLYDIASESLWSQFNGKALLGSYSGGTLEKLNYRILTIGELSKQSSTFKVMSFDTGYMRNYDIDTFATYKTDATIVGTIANTQNSFANKDIILGFNIDNKQYAILESSITDNIAKFSDESIKLQISKRDGDYQIKNIVGNESNLIKEYTTTYAFVWFDFFPNTKMISLK